MKRVEPAVISWHHYVALLAANEVRTLGVAIACAVHAVRWVAGGVAPPQQPHSICQRSHPSDRLVGVPLISTATVTQ